MHENVSLHPALKLFDAGLDLLPIIPYGAQIAPQSSLGASAAAKIPGRKKGDGRWAGWPDWGNYVFTRDDIERGVRDGAGWGLRTRNWPALDSDVADAVLAPVVRRALTDLFPDAPIREGNAPKFALAFRTQAPFPKRLLVLRDADGVERGRIEALGAGQQYVIAGTHPKTARPYKWIDLGFEGELDTFAKRPPQSLPLLAADDITSRVLPALSVALAPHGIRVELQGAKSLQAPAVDQEALRAPSIDALREAVAAIPNADRFEDRSVWLKMGHAVAAAAAGAPEGFEIFAEFSSRWEGGNDPREVKRVWDSLPSHHAVGWPWIAELARAHGYNDAAHDFDSVEGAENWAALTNAHRNVALPTTGERLAALTGLPQKVLFLESASLSGNDLFDKYKLFKAATKHGDPLKEYFRSTVLERAESVRRYAPSVDQFTVALGARLAGDAAWRSLPAAVRELLEQAAFLFVADFQSLRALRDADALAPVVVAAAEPPQLVEGFIPETSLTLFTGEPGGGKTALAILLSSAVATPPETEIDTLTSESQNVPRRFARKPVAHGRVIYCASEFADGVVRRKEAWARGRDAPKWMFVFPVVPLLTDASRAFDTAMRAIECSDAPDAPPVRLIVIDVVRDAIAGDENSSEIVSAAMATADLLRRVTGAAVLCVHHSPKSNSGDARGSSVFKAAQDVMASVSCESGVISLTVTKRRDGPTGSVFRWHFDSDGTPREGIVASASSATSESDAIAAARALHDLVTPKESVSKAAYRKHLRDHSSQFSGPRNGYRISRAIEEAQENGWVVFDVKRQSFLRGPNDLPPLVHEPGVLEIGQ